jgi:hypothetical protein
MSRRFRNLLLLAAAAGLAYWIYRDRPTLRGLVDGVTAPLFESRAAVKESEHKRVEAEVAPAIGGNQDVAFGTLRERMTMTEVRDLLGRPDLVEEVRLPKKKKTLIRWTYRRAGRVLDFDDGRVVSIAVR